MPFARQQRAALQIAGSLERETVEGLIRLVEIPSVSTTSTCLREAAQAVAELAAAAGFRVEHWASPGAPVIFASIPAPPGAPTVLFYGHYDVQPADPLDEWETSPFVANRRHGAIYGRGAGDNKGQLIAHITAARAWSAAGGCPIGMKLLIEGEEEIGSPHLAAVVEERREELACNLAITADGTFHTSGRPMIVFGVRGLLYLEATATGADRDLHSGSTGGLAPTPARNLVRGLASLWDRRDKVAVAGFYDDVRPPTTTEIALSRRLSSEDVEPPLPGDWGSLMFRPNLNIAGLRSGYGGAGVKTVVPNAATAKIDVRLVAEQDPQAIFEALRGHLETFDIAVECLAEVPPSRTPVDNPYTGAVVRALEQVWARPPILLPALGGTTPDFVFTRLLGVPSMLIPYGPADMHHHAPNERMEVAALMRGVSSSVAICGEIAATR